MKFVNGLRGLEKIKLAFLTVISYSAVLGLLFLGMLTLTMITR